MVSRGRVAKYAPGVVVYIPAPEGRGGGGGGVASLTREVRRYVWLNNGIASPRCYQIVGMVLKLGLKLINNFIGITTLIRWTLINQRLQQFLLKFRAH